MQDHIVLVVDDDRRICEALTDLLSTYDLQVVTFGSAAEYNAYPKPDVPRAPNRPYGGLPKGPDSID
jgi:FixJ family two-component response regulator